MLIFIHFLHFWALLLAKIWVWMARVKHQAIEMQVLAICEHISNSKKRSTVFSILFQLSNYPIFLQPTSYRYYLQTLWQDHSDAMLKFKLSNFFAFCQSGSSWEAQGPWAWKLSGLRRHAVSPSICVEEYAQKKHISKYWYLKGRFDLIFDRQSLCILYYNIIVLCRMCMFFLGSFWHLLLPQVVSQHRGFVGYLRTQHPQLCCKNTSKPTTIAMASIPIDNCIILGIL